MIHPTGDELLLLAYGELPASVESQTQVAIRYRFTAGL